MADRGAAGSGAAAGSEALAGAGEGAGPGTVTGADGRAGADAEPGRPAPAGAGLGPRRGKATMAAARPTAATPTPVDQWSSGSPTQPTRLGTATVTAASTAPGR